MTDQVDATAGHAAPDPEARQGAAAPGNTGAELHSSVRCLAMMMRFYNLPADPAQIAREHGDDRHSLDALGIVRAGKRLGLKTNIRAAVLSRLPRAPLPAIAEDVNGEFLIVGRATEDKILIQRPGESPRILSPAEFQEIWAGHLIHVSTRASIAGAERKFDITWFIPAIVKYRHLFGDVVLASFFLQLFGLVTPLFFQVVVDKVLVHRGLTTLEVLAVGYLAITVFDVVMGGLRNYLFAHTASRVDVELGSQLFRHLLGLPLTYFVTRAVGQTVARVRELENIRDFLTSTSITLLLDLLFTVVFFSVMYIYSPTLTYIVMGSIPFYVIISIFITPLLRRRIEEKFQRGAANQAFLVESVASIETVKSMAVEPQMRRKWEDLLAAYVRSSFRVTALGTIGSQSVQFVNKVVTITTLFLGARLVINNELTVGQLIAFNILAGQVAGPILRLAQQWQDFQQFRISIQRLGDVLNNPVEPGGGLNRASLPPIRGHIRIEHLSFRYAPDGPEILSDLNVEIQAGEIIGVVGRSGSGKSTLTKLLQRLYVPENGRILVDGVDLSLVDPSWLRRQIGVVLQENLLFSRSVRDNIAIIDPSIPMERIITAAHYAGAHEFILELPEAYDTILEERGGNLSGGQRQRIAIARALLTDPRILIFDEATSALDYESERMIRQNMKTICQGRTVILVAHRLSSLQHANRILVFDRGRLVEQGSRQELMAANGLFAYLSAQQTAGD